MSHNAEQIRSKLEATQRALARSEARFRNSIERNADGIIIVRQEDGIVRFVNPAAEALLAREAEELLGQVFGFPVVAGETTEIDLWRQDGMSIVAEMQVVETEWEGEPAYLASLRDVTDRVQMEKMLLQKTQDLNERVKELRCLYNIGHLVETHGDSLDEILQGTVDRMPPAWQHTAITRARITLDGRTFQTETFQETPWRQAADIIFHGESRGLVEVFYLEERPERDEGPFLQEERDLLNAIAKQLGHIVERIQDQKALRESEETARALLNTPTDMAALIKADGTIIDANTTVTKRFAMDREELIGTSIWDLLPTDLGARRKAHINRVFRTGEPTRFVDRRETVWADNVVYPIVDAQGNVAQVAILARDITERKRAESKLRESEEKLRQLVENAPVGIFQTTSKGQVLDVNSRMAHIAGFETREDAIEAYQDLGQELYVNADRRRDFIEKLTEKGRVENFEYEAIRRDGEHIWLSMNARISQRNPDGTFSIQGFATDITKRKQTELALREQRQRTQLLYQAGKRLGRSLNLSDIFEDTYHIIQRTMPCDSMFISSYDDQDDLIRCEWATGPYGHYDVSEFPALPLNPDGEGTQSRVIRTGQSFYFRDYQAKRQTSKKKYYIKPNSEIAEKEERPENGCVPQSALLVPLKIEGRVIGVIQVFSFDLAAFSEDDLTFLETLAPQIAAAMTNARLYQQAQSELEERKQAEETLRQYQEHLEDLVEARTAELNERVTEVERLNKALTNLLEDFQAANRRLEETRDELKNTNKELESFAYSVSHDLRAPLRAMDGFSRILIEDYAPELSPEAKRYLRLVRENAGQMGQLIDDLLTFSRLSRRALEKREVTPRSLVEQALEDLHEEQKTRQIEITIGNLPPCQADPRLLKQVWINLLSNALKYTRDREIAQIEIGSQKKDAEIVYFVKDNGVGFDMQYADKLFGVFQRLHRAEDYEGTGVGLAIVQRIVHRHGGRVWAEAEMDQGAAFYFTI
jgi:PAS domain S-box-containing protein